MTTNTDDDHILASLVKPLGVKPLFFVARLRADLLSIADQILPPSDKTELITNALNDHYGTHHSAESIRTVCNLLAIHQTFVDQVLLFNDYKAFLQQPSIINDTVSNAKFLHLPCLKPFTSQCIDCAKPLVQYAVKSIRIICKSTVTSALSITAKCSKCVLRYGHSSVESIRRNIRRITIDSLKSPSKVFYLCDTLAFTHFVLEDFTFSMLDAYSSFNGFVKTILDHVARSQPSEKDFIKTEQLTKVFETTWMLWQIVHFELMLSTETIVSIPASINREAVDEHFESFSGWWYHLFSVFWSRHEYVPNIECNRSICSRVVITDGHQKTRRLVCQCNDLIDNSLAEMGPIQIGCPIAPLRKPSTPSSVDPRFCKYHQPTRQQANVESSFADELTMAIDAAERDKQSLVDHMAECNVYRDSTLEIRKSRSFGCIVSFLSCGVTLAYDEAIRAEGMRPITRHLLRSITHGAKMPRGLVYDAGCTLYLHWGRFLGTPLLRHSVNTDQLPNKICVDYFHIRTHTRPMCKTIMRPDDPAQEGIFDGVNTALAEQSFSFLSRLKMSLRNFTYPRSTTILMLLSHLKNCTIVGVQQDSFGISARYFSELLKPRYLSATMRHSLAISSVVGIDSNEAIDVQQIPLDNRDADSDSDDIDQ